MRKHGKLILALMCMALLVCSLSVTCFAAGTGDVAGAIENTWTAAKGQIKQVVNNVIFPVVDLVLAVLFFVKVGTLYFEYKKHRCMFGASSVCNEQSEGGGCLRTASVSFRSEVIYHI